MIHQKPKKKRALTPQNAPKRTLDTNSKSILSDEEIKRLQRTVLEREKGRCILCGRTPITVHEIIPRSKHTKNSSLVFNLQNMIGICESCHRLWHTSEEFRVRSKKRLVTLLRLASR